MAIPPKFVGMPIKRREDPRLITGTATYVDDIHLSGMSYMEILRSPYAHARIVRIDTQAARHDPRVLAVLTGADTIDTPGPVPIGEVDLPNLKLPSITRWLSARYGMSESRSPSSWPPTAMPPAMRWSSSRWNLIHSRR